MGYKPEQFANPVDENLHCPVCRGVFQDPVSCVNGHTFCSECINQSLKTNNSCPLDNTVIELKKLVRNLTVKNIVDNLNVYCVPRDEENKENGEPKAKKRNLGNNQEPTNNECEWSGKLQELEKHQEECAFYPIQCPHTNCKEMVQRRHIGEHTERCVYRIVSCNNCQAQVVQHDLQQHQDNDCPDTLIPCPNNCYTDGEVSKIRRSTTKDHLDNTCANTSLACLFLVQGCTEQVLRKDMEKHLADKVNVHLSLLAKQNDQITQANSSLAKSNETLKTKLSAMKKDVKTLAATLSAVTKQFQDQLSSGNTYTWTLPDFPALCNKYACGSSFNSPFFWICGYKFRILLYPNGDSETNCSFVSIYLQCHQDGGSGDCHVVYSSEATITFRFTVVSKLPGVNDVSKTGTNNFYEEKQATYTWGWPKFMATTEALCPSYCNVTDKSLKIKCTINA